MAKIENVFCRMLHKNIDIAYCIELQMIVDEEIEPTEEEKDLTDEHFKSCDRCEIRKKFFN